MKKLISCIVLAALCIAMFAGCASTGNPETTAAAQSDLDAAKEYLYTMYKDSEEVTVTDYKVVGVVAIGKEAITVEWTTDSDAVKVVPGDDKMVTIDVDEKNPEEVSYKLTATLKDAAGNTKSVSFSHRVPAAIIIEENMSYEQIVEAAYKLEKNVAMTETQRLYGTIVKINDAYSDKYKNITVTIQIGDLKDKPIKCFRLSGEGIDKLAEGDDITVEGILKNYEGKEIEFDKGCKFLGKGEHADQSKIVEAAYKLEGSMTLDATLTGKIVKIKDPYSDKYKNITVVIAVEGMEDKPITCFRLSGEGADKLAEGNVITVTGTLKNYEGKEIEFDKGCTLDAVK